jgi:hypothetical protein
MDVYQHNCDVMGFSATPRHNQNRTPDQKVGGSSPSKRAAKVQVIGHFSDSDCLSAQVNGTLLAQVRPIINYR